MPRGVEEFLTGVEPMQRGLCKLAGDLQARGIAAEAAGDLNATFAHAEVAYLVKILQMQAGLLGEMALMLERQAAELSSREMQDRLGSMDLPKPLLIQ